jgi:CheY-like chemotaxis protein
MAATRHRRPRIAVIDDDPAFLDLMRDLLEMGEGHDVHTSGDWMRSIEFIKSVQPDVIVLDLMLGREQAGWAVIDILRADPKTRDVPIILCSAAAPALDSNAPRLRRLRAVELVAKPFDVDDLLETIERLLATAQHVVPTAVGNE